MSQHSGLDPLPQPKLIDPDASTAEILQRMSDLSQGLVDLDLLQDVNQIRIGVDAWETESHYLVDGRYDGITLNRNAGHNEFQDCLFISCSQEGTLFYQNQPLSDIVWLGDHNTDFHRSFNRARVTSFNMPYEKVGFDPTRHRSGYSIPATGRVGAVLVSALDDVLKRMPFVPSQEVPAMLDQVSDLVRDLVLGNRKDVNRSNIARARRLAINAFIETHIENPSLGAALLAHEFAVSRATLYRLFDEDGGVEAFITRRRLHRSLLGLKACTPKRGVVRQVSETFGFTDAANFNRAFKSEFGFKPSEVLGLGRAAI
ncbi:MAG: helix-turn-helix domain-containing protein [Marinibacterium sp.]|nr:helix-turn-helix domain-containing protein [Marinibacterium sp.]